MRLSIRIAAILLLTIATTTVHAADFALPADLPTIEQLQELHKLIAKAEEQAKNKVAESSGISVLITSGTKKFNDVRGVLDSKLDIANQWVSLAAILSNTTLETINLARDYAEFTKLMADNVKRKPQIAWYYGETNYEIYKLIKLSSESLGTLFLSTGNVLKASMDERLTMAWRISELVSRIRGKIDESLWYCKALGHGTLRYDFIWDILTSDVLHDISQKCIDDWNAQQKFI